MGTGLVAGLLTGGALWAEWAPKSVAVGVGLEEIFADEGRLPVYQVEVAWEEWRAGLEPVLEVNLSDAAAVFVGAGLAWRLDGEASPWGLRVGVAPGYYENGEDKFLGGTFQVMSFAEATRRFGANHRAGLRLTHLSNAGTRRVNPGTELLSVFYEFRLR